jgi:hypothetical protein
MGYSKINLHPPVEEVQGVWFFEGKSKRGNVSGNPGCGLICDRKIQRRW